ncbi:PR domain zinc finger protein 5-like [Culicoides brevitarsis]|uniref:PR domain zinc finger protein 5-like n=1 Tax=Culicoides brevitarsis TaxID=469753 RepID=UPI00307BF94E
MGENTEMPTKNACRICWNTIIGEGFHINSIATNNTLTYAHLYIHLSKIEPQLEYQDEPESLCWGCAKDLVSAYKIIRKVEEKEKIDYQPEVHMKIKVPSSGSQNNLKVTEDVKPSIFEMVVCKVEPQDYSDVENSEPEFFDENDSDSEDSDDKPPEKVKRKKSRKKYKTSYKPPLAGNLIQCVLCIYNTYNSTNYENHVLNHHNELKLKCDGCEKTFQFIYELDAHRKDLHHFVEKYVAKVVPNSKIDKIEEKHGTKQETTGQIVSQTTEETQYKLDCLGRRIPLNRKYKDREIKWPRKERKLPIKCPLCPYTGIGKSNFRNHYRVKHNKQELQCDGCDAKFHLFYRLNRHREEEHNFSHEYVVDESLKVKDEIVPRVRQKKEDKDYQCSHCDSILRGPRKLNEHLKEVHSIIKEPTRFKVICSYCGKFVVNYNLEAHIRHLHPEQRDPFICDYCGDKPKSKTALLRHMQSVHKLALKVNGTPCGLICRFCPEVFRTKHLRIAHEVRSHTFEYKFKCSICEKKFLKKQHMVEHMKRHAKGKIKQARLNCHICGEFFSRKKILAEHISATHYEHDTSNSFPENLAQNLTHLLALKYEQNTSYNE